MNFAICDDDPIFCESLSKLLKEYFQLNKIKGQKIAIYHSGEALLSSSNSFEIVFIDVEMSGISGIYTGQKLKEKNPRTIFLIITSYDSYIDEAFKFHAFRYISKPVNKIRFFNNVRDAINEYNTNNEKIMIETKTGVFSLFSSDIVFFESAGRYTDIYTLDDVYCSVRKIGDWSDTLNGSSFIRTHKSYIVNMKYINRFNSDTIFLCDDVYKARLTHRRYSEFKNSYALYLETSI